MWLSDVTGVSYIKTLSIGIVRTYDCSWLSFHFQKLFIPSSRGSVGRTRSQPHDPPVGHCTVHERSQRQLWTIYGRWCTIWETLWVPTNMYVRFKIQVLLSIYITFFVPSYSHPISNLARHGTYARNWDAYTLCTLYWE